VQCQQADPQKVAVLEHTLKRTDPFELSGRIDQQLERLYKLARRADRAPREIPSLKRTRQRLEPLRHRNPSPWRDWTFSKKLPRQQQTMKRKMEQHLG